jgi:hypothetical protein
MVIVGAVREIPKLHGLGVVSEILFTSHYDMNAIIVTERPQTKVRMKPFGTDAQPTASEINGL